MQTIPLRELSIVFIPTAFLLAIMFHWQLKAWVGLYANVPYDSSATIGRLFSNLPLRDHATNCHRCFCGCNDRGFYVDRAQIVRGARSQTLPHRSNLNWSTWANPASDRDTTCVGDATMVRAKPSCSNCWNDLCQFNEHGQLAAERFESEFKRGESYISARRTALDATLIPQINSLFAVGLVALPGMMTGQILSGVDPNIAVRYQIMVMWMIFGSGGIAAVMYLVLRTRIIKQNEN